MNRRVDFLLLCLLALASASAEENTLWQIGKLDQSSMEFSIGFPLNTVRSANLCNGVEDDLSPLNVGGKRIQLKFQSHEVLTVRLVEEIK